MAPPRSAPPPEISVDRQIELSLLELCTACGLHAERLIEMVQEGVLEPHGLAPSDWRFDSLALQRARITLRLQRDLDINLAGAALVLDLLEELQSLRRRTRLLERQLFED